MTFTNQSMDYLINIESKQLSQLDLAKHSSGYFQFSPRRAYDSFFDNYVFSDDD